MVDMSLNKSSVRKRYRKAFKEGKDVWYKAIYKGDFPTVWTKVDTNHAWKESKYYYVFTDERWSLNPEDYVVESKK